MSQSPKRKAYGAFIGSLVLTVCLAAYLSYSEVQGSDIRVWIGLCVLSISLQALITGQQGFENRREAQPSKGEASQEEVYFYCGAVFEDEEDRTPEILNPVFSRELMVWRIGGLAALLGSYLFCLKKLPGFQYHATDLIFLIGLTTILYASALRHFLLALVLCTWSVMAHQAFATSHSWVGLGAYAFLVILTLQLHRVLDLEVNDPEADFFRRHEKKTELVLRSLAWAAFAGSLVILVNTVIPQKASKDQTELSKAVGSQAIQRTLVNAGEKLAQNVPTEPKKISISQEDAIKLLQSLQVNESGKASGPEMSLPSKLELEGLIRKDLENARAGSDQQVEISKETLASLQQALQQTSGEAARVSLPKEAKSDLRLALEKVNAKVNSQANTQSNDQLNGQSNGRSSAQSNIHPDLHAEHEAGIEPVVKTKPQTKMNFDREIEILRRIAVCLALVLVAVYISKLLRKKVNPEEIHPSAVELSAEERAKLKKEWKELRKLKLTTREEVIACYHFFLKVMSSLGHERPESLPPYEYATELKPFFSAQSGSIAGVTDVFCDVFYGKEDPVSADLSRFRNQFESLCRGLI